MSAAPCHAIAVAMHEAARHGDGAGAPAIAAGLGVHLLAGPKVHAPGLPLAHMANSVALLMMKNAAALYHRGSCSDAGGSSRKVSPVGTIKAWRAAKRPRSE